MGVKCELYHDNFQNFKRYNIPKAQLVIADIPYNLGSDAYASNPVWMHTQESDYLQEKLDANLREIFPECPPFQERYPHTREWNYNKAVRK